MRCRAVFFILILLASCGLYAFTINTDALASLTLFTPGKGGRLTSTFELLPDLRAELSLGFHRINTDEVELNVFEGGLAFDLFPLAPYGFYTGVSLLHLCYLTGLDCPASPLIDLLDIRVGYLFLMKHLTIDIRFDLCQIGSSLGSDAKILQDNFYQFKKFNFMVLLGWEF